MPDLMFPQTSTVSERARSTGLAIFLLIIAVGVAYVAVHLVIDLEPVKQSSAFPYVLLGFAMLIALGFEFVNGFHDTANAVATVIYTHSLTPNLAVLWSGAWNFGRQCTQQHVSGFGSDSSDGKVQTARLHG
jgi:PiT family inorganic phosphate transporter